MINIYNKFKNIINAFLLIFLCIILFSTITNVSGLNFFNGINKNYMIILNVLFTIIFIFTLNLINKKLIISDKSLTIIKYLAFLLLVIIQILLIINFDVKPMTDSYAIIDQANAIVNNVTSKIDYNFYHYFEIYKNNNFYLLLTIYLIKIFKFIKIVNPITGMIIFNTIMIDLSIIITYLLTKKIINKRVAILTLILLCLNPLNYFMIFWTYTCSYSLPFVVGIIYLAVLIKDCDKKILQLLYGFIFGLVLITCYFLRPIIVIPLIAIIICFIFDTGNIKYKISKYSLPIVCILISSIFCFFFINSNINKYTEKKDTYFPSTHWIMMGLHGNGEYSESDYIYTHKYKTTEKMKKANLKEIVNTLKEYKISGLINHSINKLFVTWSDGNCRYYDRLSQDMNEHNSLNKWLIGSKRDLTVIYCNVFRIAIIILTILYLIDEYKNKKNNNFILKLTLFGAIAFYLLWEAKDIYSYPFLFLLSIFSAVKIDNLKIKNINKVGKKEYIIFSITLLLVLFGLKYNITNIKNETNTYYLRVQNEFGNNKIKNILSDKIVVSQEFSLYKKFNKIDIKANKINDVDLEYKIVLYKNDEEIKTFIKKSQDINDGFITLDVDYDKTGKGDYLIVIDSNEEKKEKDSISWNYIKSLSVDNYKGNLVIDNDLNMGDLYIKVYKKSNEKYMNPILFWILYFIIIIILYLQYKIIYVEKKLKTTYKQKK